MSIEEQKAAQAVDVLAVWDRLMSSARTLSVISSDLRMQNRVKDGVQARAIIAKLIEREAHMRKVLAKLCDAYIAHKYGIGSCDDSEVGMLWLTVADVCRDNPLEQLAAKLDAALAHQAKDGSR